MIIQKLECLTSEEWLQYVLNYDNTIIPISNFSKWWIKKIIICSDLEWNLTKLIINGDMYYVFDGDYKNLSVENRYILNIPEKVQ